MWYFAWILGVTAALAIAIINVMWYDFQSTFEDADRADAEARRPAGREGRVG